MEADELSESADRNQRSARRTRLIAHRARRGVPRVPVSTAEPPNSPRAGARFRPGEPRDGELAEFCAAMFDASQSTVIAAAVSAFINAELAKNEGIRERYEKLGRARREGTATKVHLIKARE